LSFSELGLMLKLAYNISLVMLDANTLGGGFRNDFISLISSSGTRRCEAKADSIISDSMLINRKFVSVFFFSRA